MNTIKRILCLIVCALIIAGIAVWKNQGLKLELQYSTRDQMNISRNTSFDTEEVKTIVAEVLGNDTRYFVQNVETFGNSVSIVADEITEDQKKEIVSKFNEKFGTKINADDIVVAKIPFTRIKDVLRPFIIPGIITIVLVVAYFLIRFRRLIWYKILAKTVIIPVVAELLLYSIVAICRIPFGRVAISCGIALYVITIAILSNCFENEREKKVLEELEKTEGNE